MFLKQPLERKPEQLNATITLLFLIWPLVVVHQHPHFLPGGKIKKFENRRDKEFHINLLMSELGIYVSCLWTLALAVLFQSSRWSPHQHYTGVLQGWVLKKEK